MIHVPVLLKEVLRELKAEEPGFYLDCTVGVGGHAEAILKQNPDNRVIGIDRDEEALQLAKERLTPFGERVQLYHGNYREVEEILESARAVFLRSGGEEMVSNPAYLKGVLFDLGVSSLQLDRAERGFSFQKDAFLDMRMDQTQTLTAFDVVNRASQEELEEIFSKWGEERWARSISRKIVEERKAGEIRTTGQLAQIVQAAIPKRFQSRGIHPATKVFQALRIKVNQELDFLKESLERVVSFLKTGGRLCVISFHSLEDRIVKETFLNLAKGCQCPPWFPTCVCGRKPVIRLVHKRPITPSEEEKKENPRSRSAKLRVAEKINVS